MSTALKITIVAIIAFAIYTTGYINGMNFVEDEWSAIMHRHMRIHHSDNVNKKNLLLHHNQNEQR
jgi:hypothetical protein